MNLLLIAVLFSVYFLSHTVHSAVKEILYLRTRTRCEFQLLVLCVAVFAMVTVLQMEKHLVKEKSLDKKED